MEAYKAATASARATDTGLRPLPDAMGAGAGQSLVLCAKAHALMKGRLHVTSDDLGRVARAVLRHRILVNFQAEAEGRTPDEVVESLLAEVAPPRSRLL